MAFGGRILVVPALCLAGLTLVAASPATTGKSAPMVRIARLAPLQVSGTGFGRRSSVHITVRWNAKSLSKTVVASPAGKVTASFGTSLTILACRATAVTAVAGNGLKATWQPASKSCYAIAMPVSPTG
jgi:hypothetical protein